MLDSLLAVLFVVFCSFIYQCRPCEGRCVENLSIAICGARCRGFVLPDSVESIASQAYRDRNAEENDA